MSCLIHAYEQQGMPYGHSQADLGRISLQIFQLLQAHICKGLLVQCAILKGCSG